MGACMQPPKKKKDQKDNKKPKSTKPNTNKVTVSELMRGGQQMKEEEPVKPKYQKMTINELLITYRNQCTLELSSKLEGPKYLSNIVDGSSKVLRIINLQEIDQNRLQIYRQLLGFQIYENDQGTLMILDEYCSGEDVFELIDKYKDDKGEEAKGQLLRYMRDVFSIVSQFHKKKIWLGNLNFSSFRKVSIFEEDLRLVDMNLTGNVSDLQKVGFAHKQSFEADYEFMGYLLQLLLSQQTPIFLVHKMQYIQFTEVPHFSLIQSLLRGKRCNEAEIKQIRHDKIVVNQKAALGYKFRRDLNKLLKMRKKRKAHNRKFYGQDTHQMITEVKFNEEVVYRHQTERIFQRIHTYIYRIKSGHEEAFLNYAGNNDSLRRLKEIFLLGDGEKKMSELKECLPTIK